ncbi:MAG: HAMP domain-containing histidine kinase [Chloroflexi bacterium]|nr:HAMP domain-containing histidine kinase [Chloroflexota bacterium]
MRLPSAEPARRPGRPAHLVRTLSLRARRLAPRTFQGRLTLGFVGVVAVTLALVSLLVVNRLGVYFVQQQRAELEARGLTVAQYVAGVAESVSDPGLVVGIDGVVNPAVAAELTQSNQQRILADSLAQADVDISIGTLVNGQFTAAPGGQVHAVHRAQPVEGQLQESLVGDPVQFRVNSPFVPYVVEVTLSNPYTFRATALANVTGLLAIIGLIALGVSIVVAAGLARRFTVPLRRLTEASRGLAEGDLSRRVPLGVLRAGPAEMTELALAFNTMAARVEEAVELIRRDRDRSRDFLADVSHELRTPIAALRTFNELLRERAGADPVARAEFLESSAGQLERLDWLAQNLLELSKLESGLVLLDLRPDDLRATVEQAIQQAAALAERRDIELDVRLPQAPIRIRHDAVRIGQVVTNLVANGIKFTARGGRVGVEVRPQREGARIVVTDNGVGIDPSELPHVFERFYRGSQASEARGSGSGLGLAIVHSIVDMHGGSVVVESRVGAGSTFTVWLPRDPREPAREEAATSGSTPDAPPEPGAEEEEAEIVADSYPRPAPDLNVEPRT